MYLPCKAVHTEGGRREEGTKTHPLFFKVSCFYPFLSGQTKKVFSKKSLDSESVALGKYSSSLCEASFSNCWRVAEQV